MRKVVSLLLAMCMLLTLVPTVFAAEEAVPDVKFSAEYVESGAYFKLTVEVTVNDYVGNAWVRVGAFKDNILQKLVLNEKIDTSTLALLKTVKYDVVVETEKPQEYVFKCFTFEENMRPLLPVSVITGESVAGPMTTTLKGVVTGNSFTSIYGDKNVDTAPTIKISITDNCGTDNADFAQEIDPESGALLGYTHSGSFRAKDYYAGNYIGSAVVFEVVKDEVSGEYIVESIRHDEDKFDVKSFTLDQFDYADYDTIWYYENPADVSSTRISLDSNVSVVYNGVGGQYLTDILSDESAYGIVVPYGRSKQSGRVTMINNDGVSGYDVVLVETAAPAVVKSVADGRISFEKAVNLPDGMSVIAELEPDKTAVLIRKDNRFIEYTELEEGDVLSVIAESDDADYILVEVVTNKIEGSIESVYSSRTSAGNYGYKINGINYDISQGAYEAIGHTVGDAGTFWINNYGKIAAFFMVEVPDTAVVLKTTLQNDDIDGKFIRMQMLSETGEIEIVNFVNRVTFQTPEGTQTLYQEKATYTGNPESDADNFFGQSLKGQVIKFKKNAYGKITEIALADYDDNFWSLTAADGIYDKENGKIGTRYIDDDAIVFFVDYNQAMTDFDSDKCKVGTVADLEDGANYSVYNNRIYADSDATDFNIVVILGGLTTISPVSSVAVIISVAISEIDGENVYALEYLRGGEIVDAETVAYSDLVTNYSALGSVDVIGAVAAPTIGDVVKLKLNPDGKIVNLTYLFNMTAAVRMNQSALSYDLVTSAGSYNYGEFVDAGYATAYNDISEIIKLNSGNEYKLSQAENVYVVDASGRAPSVKVGTTSNFRYHEALYSTTHKANIKYEGTIVETDIEYGTPAWDIAAAKYTDYVFVRLYNGKVKDVVIVKAVGNIKVTEGTAIPIPGI